jgi:hypothetical protein
LKTYLGFTTTSFDEKFMGKDFIYLFEIGNIYILGDAD